MWGMQHASSDVDYAAVWCVDPLELLRGTHSEAQRNHRVVMAEHSYPGSEESYMEATEVSHLVHLLLGSNVNAIQRTLSPIEHVSTPEFNKLRKLVQSNRAKNIYDSTSGMNSANLKRYWKRVADEGEAFGAKKAGQIMRVVNMAVRVLDGKPYTFDAVHGATLEDCKESLDTLHRAYENSSLPERPPENLYRDWVMDVRMDRLGVL